MKVSEKVTQKVTFNLEPTRESVESSVHELQLNYIIARMFTRRRTD